MESELEEEEYDDEKEAAPTQENMMTDAVLQQAKKFGPLERGDRAAKREIQKQRTNASD